MFARWRAAGLIVPSLMTLVMLPVLIGLGTWQMNRKVWKEDLIAKIASRPKAEPVSLKEVWEQFQKTGEAEYVRVRVRGTFDHSNERHLYAPADNGLGWDVYTLFQPEGSLPFLFINRGWVPDNLKDPATRVQGQIEGPTEITGLVRSGQRKGSFSAVNDPNGNRWYWRDLEAMKLVLLQRLQQSSHGQKIDLDFAPFSLDAEAEPANPGGWPKGGATFVQLSNRHLEYAVTWYGTALTLLGVFIVFARQRLAQISGDKPVQLE